MDPFGFLKNKYIMIKNSFNPGNYHNKMNLVLLIIRFIVGIFMLTHGTGKLMSLFGSEAIQFPDPLGVGTLVSLILTVFSEVICSVFLIFGVATRFSAITLLFTMLVAAFVIHATDGFGKQELPLLYAVIYLVIAVAGARKFSVDAFIYPKLNRLQR